MSGGQCCCSSAIRHHVKLLQTALCYAFNVNNKYLYYCIIYSQAQLAHNFTVYYSRKILSATVIVLDP